MSLKFHYRIMVVGGIYEYICGEISEFIYLQTSIIVRNACTVQTSTIAKR